MATRAIYQFCTVTLSARYFDIIKDRLYTFCAAQSCAPLGADGALPDRRCAGANAGADPGVYGRRDLGKPAGG